MGRRSVWSDQRVLEACASFVPAADEVWRLQRDDDPECRWFREAVRGSSDQVAGSMQGTYVITASGELLGRINSSSPDRVLAMLERALEKWRALPAASRDATAPDSASPKHRWEDSFPSDGLALVRFARDVEEAPTQPPAKPVNRDTVWFSAAELRGLVPTRGEAGAAREVDPALSERLARFAFVDNVRGQTLPFSASSIRAAALRSEVVAVEGDRWTMRLTGRTHAVTDGSEPGEDYWRSNRQWPRSMATEVLGQARWNATERRFESFELVALGTRTGRTTFNGRAREAEGSSHRVGFLLRCAPPGLRVAPTFVNLYGVDWITTPK